MAERSVEKVKMRQYSPFMGRTSPTKRNYERTERGQFLRGRKGRLLKSLNTFKEDEGAIPFDIDKESTDNLPKVPSFKEHLMLQINQTDRSKDILRFSNPFTKDEMKIIFTFNFKDSLMGRTMQG